MSAFIVSNETMNKVIAGFEMMYDDLTDELKIRFGNRFFRMNKDAVDYRYKTNSTRPRFVFTPKLYQPVEIYKAVQCLAYQCSEGNLPETKLFRRLEQLKLFIGEKIITQTKEYENAKWD